VHAAIERVANSPARGASHLGAVVLQANSTDRDASLELGIGLTLHLIAALRPFLARLEPNSLQEVGGARGDVGPKFSCCRICNN
jgi:hypothetical protein